MDKSIPRFLQFQGFKTVELKEWLSKGYVEVFLEPVQEMRCYKCDTDLQSCKDMYRIKVRHLNICNYLFILIINRRKGLCPNCRKVRSEKIDFLSEGSPHITKEFAWFVTRLCEIASVAKASKIAAIDKSVGYRVDHRMLIRMLGHFRIPKLTKISVDEVYARKKKVDGETRDDLFFTVITDLRTRKVIYVAHSRRKEALDEFFSLIGKEACSKIKVVACDQHEAYKKSVEEHCPKAVVVWDRFHLVQNFNEVLNEARKTLFNKKFPDEVKQRLHGRYRFIFLTKASQRTKEQAEHVKELMDMNQEFFLLELIKETVIKFFNSLDECEAREIWDDLGMLIFKLYDMSLVNWYRELNQKLDQLLLYFTYRVTTAVSEGFNNVIKSLKRQAFGYRDMNYFRLKILQKCGFLNSDYISNPYGLVPQ